MSGNEPGPATVVLDGLEGLARGEIGAGGVVSLGEIVARFGREAFVAVMLVVALIIVSPLSGIPLLPTACGSIIVLIVLQMMLMRRRLWLPGFLLRRQIDAERLLGGAGRLRRPAAWLDRHTRPRYGLIYRWPFRLIVEGLCLVSAGAMPFLELIPFSSSLLGAAICFVALGLFSRDGLMLIPALLFLVAAAMIPGLVIYRFAS